jgi:hypothetical protein
MCVCVCVCVFMGTGKHVLVEVPSVLGTLCYTVRKISPIIFTYVVQLKVIFYLKLELDV